KGVFAPGLWVVLVGFADSLWCFACENQSNNLSCLKITKCSDVDKHCLTTVGYAGIGKCQDH
uniref:Snake toxin/toxin-like domain-containing protein n=1 Tax=Gopherus evgoodei TaxID=1825980 RepID=A0A8C4YFW4_9SAUR